MRGSTLFLACLLTVVTWPFSTRTLLPVIGDVMLRAGPARVGAPPSVRSESGLGGVSARLLVPGQIPGGESAPTPSPRAGSPPGVVHSQGR